MMRFRMTSYWFWQLVMTSYFIFFTLLAQSRVLAQPGIDSQVHLGFLLLFPLLSIGLAWLVFKRWRWYVLALAGTLICLLMLSDLAYLRYFDTFPSLLSRIPMRQAWGVHSSVLALLRGWDVIPLILSIGIWIYAIVFYRKQLEIGLKADPRLGAKSRYLGIGIALVSGIWLWIACLTPVREKTHHVGRQSEVLPSEHWGKNYSNVSFARVYGTFIYHVNDIQRRWSMRKLEPVISEQERRQIRVVLDEVYLANQKYGMLQGAAKGFNVVVIQLEAFQEFLIDKKVEGQEVTPFLNRLKRKGIFWDRIFDVTGLGRTSDTEFTINTGLFPDRDYAAAFTHLDKDLITLPNLLASEGYVSSSVHGYNKDFWNRAQAHPFYGYKAMLFEKELGSQNKLGMGTPDKDTFHAAVNYYKTVKKPFFSLIISLSCHHPFNAFPEDMARMYSSVGDGPMAGYLRLAAYTDQALEIFFLEMEKAGLADKTVFVLCGDHDLGQINPMVPGVKSLITQTEKAIGTNPFDPLEDRVPLFLVMPGLESRLQAFKKDYDYPSGCQTDIFPTILHLLGVKIPFGIFGENLLQTKLKHPIPQGYAFFPQFVQIRKRTATNDDVITYPELISVATVYPLLIPGRKTLLSPKVACQQAQLGEERYLLCESMLRGNLQKQFEQNHLLAEKK